MRRALLALVAALALVLSGCSGGSDDAADELLAPHGLDGMGTQELIDHMDRIPGPERPTNLLASVRAETLVLSDGSVEHEVDIEGDEFYLSFAPYVDGTHECYYHSLTTCQGELRSAEMHVRITTDDGQVLIDERMTTFDNGFIGVWLPRDISATLEVSHDDLSATAEVSTDDQAPTCLTTVHLT